MIFNETAGIVAFLFSALFSFCLMAFLFREGRPKKIQRYFEGVFWELQETSLELHQLRNNDLMYDSGQKKPTEDLRQRAIRMTNIHFDPYDRKPYWKPNETH